MKVVVPDPFLPAGRTWKPTRYCFRLQYRRGQVLSARMRALGERREEIELNGRTDMSGSGRNIFPATMADLRREAAAGEILISLVSG